MVTHDKRCPLFVYSLRAPTDLRDGAGMTAVTSSLAGWTEGFVRLVCTRCDVGLIPPGVSGELMV